MLLHTGIKNHQCEVCNQMFCSRSNLLSHKAQSKCGAEEVVCPTCGKKCSNKYYLKRHIVRHTAERQFKCEFEGCGKSFFDQHVLRSHEKIHLGIKDFHCSLCPKQFTQSQQLSVHMKRHNGVMSVHGHHCHRWKFLCRWKTTNVWSVEKLLWSQAEQENASMLRDQNVFNKNLLTVDRSVCLESSKSQRRPIGRFRRASVPLNLQGTSLVGSALKINNLEAKIYFIWWSDLFHFRCWSIVNVLCAERHLKGTKVPPFSIFWQNTPCKKALPPKSQKNKHLSVIHSATQIACRAYFRHYRGQWWRHYDTSLQSTGTAAGL